MTDEDAEIRRQWRDLVDRALPEEASRRGREWPVSLNHCFARILLDNAVGRPWREVIRPPAWRHADARTLADAIALGEAVLSGRASLHDLNQVSLLLRRKTRY
jgi:hypothetical protein